MSLKSKAIGWAQKAGGALILAATYGVSAKALTTDDIEAVPVLGTSSSLSHIINNLIQILLWAAGLLAVIYLIWGGLTYVTAGGDSEKAGKGRVAITNAIIGIVIIVAALVIYNTATGLAGSGKNAI